jgi:predicted metal-dependent peptidase
MGERGKFLGELNGLIKSFGLFELTILDVDAEVNDVRHFTQDDNLENIIENGEFTLGGGGGTCMLPGFNKIIDDEIECDAIICLTDGYIDNIPNNPIPSLPTLWIITKDGTEDFCDWGQKIHLKESGCDEY